MENIGDTTQIQIDSLITPDAFQTDGNQCLFQLIVEPIIISFN